MVRDELCEFDWLAACSDRELAVIRRRVDLVDIPAGTTLIHEGESARWFYAVIRGNAAVSIDGELIDTIGDAQPVNELDVLRNHQSAVTVTAQTDLRVLVMGRREFLGMLDETPGLARRLLMPHIPAVAPAGRRAVLVPLPAA